MSQLILDNLFLAKLRDLKQITQLCDPNGKVVGEFVPKLDLSAWEPITPEVSQEELDRRAHSKEWYTTAQALDHLSNLR